MLSKTKNDNIGIKKARQELSDFYDFVQSRIYFGNDIDKIPESYKEAIKAFWRPGRPNTITKDHRRALGHIHLNKPFLGSERHHVDKEHIINIPKYIHQSIYHNVITGQGMEEINTIAFRYIDEDTFDKLIAGEI